jgi:hypothetical protein
MEKENTCLEDGKIYSDGSEYCLDLYCFKCVDGEWETQSLIGDSVDPSLVL